MIFFRAREIQRKKELREKKIDDLMKNHDNLSQHIAKNAEYENKSKNVSSVNDFNNMSVEHFSSVEADLLKLFARARSVEDL